MGRSAEGPFVYLGVLYLALGCSGITVFLDRRSEVQLSYYETIHDSNLHDSLGTVYL